MVMLNLFISFGLLQAASVQAAPDTVSVAEMKTAFERYASQSASPGIGSYAWIKPYNERDSGVVVLADRDRLYPCAGTAQWTCHDWRLYRKPEKTVVPAEDSLRTRYGTTSYGIPAQWISGRLEVLGTPMTCMGFLVSGAKSRFRVEQGRMWLEKEEVRRSLFVHQADSLFLLPGTGPDGEEIVTLVDNDFATDWTTSGNIADTDQLGDFVNRIFQHTRARNTEMFQLLLVIQPDGSMRMERLRPLQPNAQQSKLLERLQKAVRQLPKGAFLPLWNVDGRIFPARYLEAVYTAGKWHFRNINAK